MSVISFKRAIFASFVDVCYFELHLDVIVPTINLDQEKTWLQQHSGC